MQPLFSSILHLFHLLSPPLLPFGQIYLHSHTRTLFSQITKNYFLMGNKACRGSHTLPVKATSGPFNCECNFVYFNMHPRRRNGYKMSYKNPVAADPAGAHAMETPAAHEAGACSIHHQEIGSQGLVASGSQQKRSSSTRARRSSKQIQHSSS